MRERQPSPAPAGTGPERWDRLLASPPMSAPDPAARRRFPARTLRLWLWRARHLVVAVCCGAAAASAVQVLAPAPPLTRDVVVAARALEPGSELKRADVEVRAVPTALVPADAIRDPDEAVGRVPAVRLAAGLPLSAELVAGGAFAALAPAGTVVVPVRLDDATAGLLRPGDRVDLVTTAVATGADGAATGPGYLARRALVLPSRGRPTGGDSGGGLLGGATGQDPSGGGDGATVLAVSPQEAPGLSAASSAGAVAAVLVP